MSEFPDLGSDVDEKLGRRWAQLMAGAGAGAGTGAGAGAGAGALSLASATHSRDRLLPSAQQAVGAAANKWSTQSIKYVLIEVAQIVSPESLTSYGFNLIQIKCQKVQPER